ncbi:MAG: PIG-L family deacetylase [Elusimicrobia bacterium]|nr:PIG-L family deacetylase [Elusimicrobiota bacterium]
MRWTPPRGKVLVLAPHPDDESIGCGGVVALHADRGDRVHVVIATDGAAGDPKGYFRGKDYRALRRDEARQACRVLGAASAEFWEFPDGRLARARGLSRRLKTLLAEYAPDVVYRPSAKDPHPDHRALARGFESAAEARPRRFHDCRYEVCYLQPASALVDVSRVFAKKLAAIRKHKTQLRYQDYAAVASRTALLRSVGLAGCSSAEGLDVTEPEA